MATRRPCRPGRKTGRCLSAHTVSPSWRWSTICTFISVSTAYPLGLRYANVYGPRQNGLGEAGVVAIFIEKFLAGEQPVINGDGLQTRDFVYVGDVVAANLLALDYPREGIFNIGTGKETDILTVYLQLQELVGSSQGPVHGPAKPGEQRRSALDSTLARERLNWQPRVSLVEG